jgi:hypothetical protein
VIPPDASGRPTILNTSFTYPGIELWDPTKWPRSKVAPIVAWIETHQTNPGGEGEYVENAKYKGIKNFPGNPDYDFVGNPDYSWRTDGITDPAVVDSFAKMGLHVSLIEGGGLRVIVTPDKVIADKEHKAPIIIVRYVMDKMDAFWGMKTLAHFKKYNEFCAQRGDFILVYSVLDKSVAGLGSAVSTAGADGDTKRVYLDVSAFQANGTKFADVSGLNWSDNNGKKIDPDAAVEHIGFIPVLNIAGRTTARPSYDLAPHEFGTFGGIIYPINAEVVEHGEIGQHWMEGIRFAYEHGNDDDPALKARFEEMGLVGVDRDYKGKRYLLYRPREAVEQGTKLPLVILNQTAISRANQYSISDTYVKYLDYFKLAAKGDINILVMALANSSQDHTKLDLAHEIVMEVEKTIPIDSSRVYVTGHAGGGHEAREFGYQYPGMIAAVAQLGNVSGYAPATYSHETIAVDDQRIAAWSKIDMPTITIGTPIEELNPHDMKSHMFADYDQFIDAWQRRLRAQRCPPKTREQIMATAHSSDYVTRLYGLPNDGSSLQIVDSVEHYIIDVKNIDGRNHLRIVTVQNMIHTPEPTMPMLSWSWMRRFARDQTTGKVIELY